MTLSVGVPSRRSPPWVGGAEATLALLRDPYRFIGNHCRREGVDVVEARLLLQRTLCMTGPRAARLFYDPDRFVRAHAAPAFLTATLLGRGGVQMLDGAAHRHRKAMFMAATGPDPMRRLLDKAMLGWVNILETRRPASHTVSLYEISRQVLMQAACGWAAVPLPPQELASRTRALTLLFDGSARGLLGHWQARRARAQSEAWLAHVVNQARAGRLDAPSFSPLHLVAWHRDELGVLMPPRVAAVELLNLLQPIVAVAVFIVFAAHALQCSPGVRDGLRAGVAAHRRAFVQEVRRYYPFFPAAVARVRRTFEWNDCTFPAGQRVLFDLYGTNHDPAVWGDPHSFRPERFLERPPGPFDFVPQGAGDAHTQHRCPGEGLTVALMEQSVDLLLQDLQYAVPPQDLEIDMARLPALPRDHFMVQDLRMSLSTRPYVRPLEPSL